jgi:acetoacetate decarboxylase
MSFVNENVLEDLKEQMKGGGTIYTDAEFLYFFWLSSKEVYNRLLPYPLKPLEDPIVWAFVADYPEVEGLFPYNGLSLLCQYKGKIGMYWLSMGLTDDVAVFLGREIYGFPKKCAEITFTKKGDLVEGSGLRRQMPIFSVKASLTGNVNDSKIFDLMEKYNFGTVEIPNYNFKELLSTSGKNLDYFPRLTECWGKSDVHEDKFGEVEVELSVHPYDPWNEVKIVKLLGGRYVKSNTVLTAAKDLKKIGIFRVLKYMPHAFKKYDMRK